VIDVKVNGYPLAEIRERGVEWGGSEPDGTVAVVFDDEYDFGLFRLEAGVLVYAPLAGLERS
jgi:hypothetical protein